MGCLRVNNCCCGCCSLSTGAKIISVLGIVLSVIPTIFVIVAFFYIPDPDDPRLSKASSIFALTGCGIAVNILLWYGAHRRYHTPLLIWLISTVITLLVTLLVLVPIFIVIIVLVGGEANSTIIFGSIIAVLLVLPAVGMYEFMVVYSLYQEVKEEQSNTQEGMVLSDQRLAEEGKGRSQVDPPPDYH